MKAKERKDNGVTNQRWERYAAFVAADDWSDWDAESDLWPSHGDIAVQWAQDNLIHGPGKVAGRPLTFRADQIEWMYRWFEYNPITMEWRYTEALKGEARGGAKTELAAALAMIELAGPPEIASPNPDVPVVAASYDNAGVLFSVCQMMAGGQGGTGYDCPLKGQFHVQDAQIVRVDGAPGRLYRVAAQAGTQEGGRPTMMVADEIHELTGNKERVLTVLSTGLQKQTPIGRQVSITTAGAGRGSIPARPDDSFAWRYYVEGLKQREDPGYRPQFLFDWKEAPADIDLTDDDQVLTGIRAASGAADVIWRATDRLKRFRDETIPQHEHERYLLNRWVKVAADNWLADRPGAWARCETGLELSDGQEVWLGLDGALRNDSMAVATVGWVDGRAVWETMVWTSHQQALDYTAVEDYLIERGRRFKVLGLAFDPRLVLQLAQRLELEHDMPAMEVPQSGQRRSRMDAHAYEQIVSGVVAHRGDPVLTDHVNNAVWRESETGRVLSKRNSGGHIDGLIAGSMAHWHLTAPDMEPVPQPFMVVL